MSRPSRVDTERPVITFRHEPTLRDVADDLVERLLFIEHQRCIPAELVERLRDGRVVESAVTS
jgi:hypothetical protein